MGTFAYRWADGSVSICGARNRDEAAWLFDEVGPVSRKLIIKLKASLLITLSPDIDEYWKFDEEGPKLGEDIEFELPEKCYPRYEKAYSKVMEILAKNNECLADHAEFREQIQAALEEDVREAKMRIKNTPLTPDFLIVYPRERPGQNN